MLAGTNTNPLSGALRDEEEEMVDDQTSVRAIREYYRPPYTEVELMHSNNENELPLLRLSDKEGDGANEEIQLDTSVTLPGTRGA